MLRRTGPFDLAALDLEPFVAGTQFVKELGLDVGQGARGNARPLFRFKTMSMVVGIANCRGSAGDSLV